MTKSFRDRVPEYIRNIDPYKPGRPIEEVERELGIRAVKLASNENPLGPSPKAVEAAQRALADSNRYPDAGGFYLREKLAARLHVPAEQIILGLGSSELIDLTARLLLRPGDEAVTSAGSFPLYYISTQASGAKLARVPMPDFAYDLDGLARAVTARTRVLFIANPNNPTGTMFTAAAFDAFLSKIPDDVLVVLDEAYFEYVEREDYSRSLHLVKAGRNLFVLRTFSKIYGLAGIRIGYGIGPLELLELLNKLRTPFNTSGVSQAAAMAALDDAGHVRRSMESNRAGLAQLAHGLAGLGLKAVPSVTNFVLFEVAEPKYVCDALLKRGIIVRPMKWMGFDNGIRITVGTPDENEQSLAALREALAEIAEGTPAAG